MKNKKILLLIFLLLLTIVSTKSSINANAKEIFDGRESPISDTEFYNTDYHIFKKGYYLFIGEGDIEPFKFSGDISYYYSDSASISLYESKLGVESTYKADLIEAIELLNDDYSKLPNNKVIFIRVNSFGMMYYEGDEGCWQCYCYGVELHEENTTSSTGDKCHVVSVDNRLTIDEILARYSYQDNVDNPGNLTVNYYTTYNKNSSLGLTPLYIEVSDSCGNTSATLDYVYIHDFVAPTISTSQDTYEIEVNTILTSDQVKEYFKIEDNYTIQLGIKKTYEDNYNSNYNKLGNYTYSCTAKDQQGNSTTKTININVVDTTNPVITLKDGGSVIHANSELSNEEIYSLLNVSDNYDTFTMDNIEISTNCEGLEGVEYQISVTATDSSGNSTTETFSYYINDTTPPSITVRDVIYLEKDRKYTSEEMLAILKNAGLISNSATNVNFIEENLISSDDNEDVYQVTYEEILEDGTINYGSLTLKYQKDNTKNNSIYYYIIPTSIIGLSIILFIIKKRKKINANK